MAALSLASISSSARPSNMQLRSCHIAMHVARPVAIACRAAGGRVVRRPVDGRRIYCLHLQLTRMIVSDEIPLRAEFVFCRDAPADVFGWLREHVGRATRNRLQ
jgi:hypothetical protein